MSSFEVFRKITEGFSKSTKVPKSSKKFLKIVIRKECQNNTFYSIVCVLSIFFTLYSLDKKY